MNANVQTVPEYSEAAQYGASLEIGLAIALGVPRG